MDKIFHNGKLVAVRVRRFQDGIVPATGESDPLQLLTQKRPKGHVVKPHTHTPKKRVTALLQEGLIVIKGKIRVDLYGSDKKCFRKLMVKEGEAIVFFGIPHAVHFLEDSLAYEVKNGPFIDDKVSL
ncbi:MAG: hypothetical protein Q7R93_03415 [bacterium]|nr:hypothetical protein [bacterium]